MNYLSVSKAFSQPRAPSRRRRAWAGSTPPARAARPAPLGGHGAGGGAGAVRGRRHRTAHGAGVKPGPWSLRCRGPALARGTADLQCWRPCSSSSSSPGTVPSLGHPHPWARAEAPWGAGAAGGAGLLLPRVSLAPRRRRRPALARRGLVAGGGRRAFLLCLQQVMIKSFRKIVNDRDELLRSWSCYKAEVLKARAVAAGHGGCLSPGSASRRAGVMFAREGGHPGRAASPPPAPGPGHLRGVPGPGTICCGSPQPPTSQPGLRAHGCGWCWGARAAPGCPWHLLGPEHRPRGLAAVPAVWGGRPGRGSSPAVPVSLLERSLRPALHVVLPPAGPCCGRSGSGAGVGAAVTLLSDLVAWEHPGSCRCQWHLTTAC